MRKGAAADFTGLSGLRVLIALSGGADSVALASMLAEARNALQITLLAAHLDHAIRPESAEDAAFCGRLCARLGIPLYTARVDVPAEAARTGEGLETAARRLRHQWLRQVKDEVGADVIALAHHMDDQAETVLMHLARGTGPEGIGGMRSAPATSSARCWACASGSWWNIFASGVFPGGRTPRTPCPTPPETPFGCMGSPNWRKPIPS